MTKTESTSHQVGNGRSRSHTTTHCIHILTVTVDTQNSPLTSLMTPQVDDNVVDLILYVNLADTIPSRPSPRPPSASSLASP